MYEVTLVQFIAIVASIFNHYWQVSFLLTRNRFGPVITKSIDVIFDMFEKYNVSGYTLGIQYFFNYIKTPIFGQISGFN